MCEIQGRICKIKELSDFERSMMVDVIRVGGCMSAGLFMHNRVKG